MSAQAPTPCFHSSTLFDSYVQCVKSFAAFAVRLGSDEYLENCTEELDLANILHEYGRLNIWGDQTKANLPPRARGSLDDTLRHDAKLKDLVLEILLRLNTLLEKGTEAATDIAQATSRPDQPGASAQRPSRTASSDRGPNETGSGSGSGSDGEDEDELAISYMAQLATEQIRALYDLSTLLRRPTISSKYIRSIKKTVESEPVTEIVILRRAFGSFEYNHIIEKVDQWRGQTKSSKKINLVKEEAKEASAAEDAPPLGSCEGIAWLCRRFAEANMRRREQIEYSLGHPFDPKAHQPSTTTLMPEIAVKDLAKGGEDGDRIKSEASRPQLAPVPAKDVTSESQRSRQSFSTVAASDVYDTNTTARPRTIYTPTEAGNRTFTSVPNPPKPLDSSQEPSFQCPYCGMLLNADEMKSRQLWKRHVFRDLRPYVCTFEQCQNAAKLYVSRNDWIYHELQAHRRQFVCVECDGVFPDRPSMGQHLKKDHYSGPMQQAQLPMLVDLCGRQADDTYQDACIVCGKELALSELQLHLAAHMEEIALFALPIPVDAEVEESLASGRAAKSTRISDLSTEDGTTDGDDDDDDNDASASPAATVDDLPIDRTRRVHDEATFLAVQAECETLFLDQTAQSTTLAMEMWRTACVDVQPHVGIHKWMDLHRDFIAVLDRKNLFEAASKVRGHLWMNVPVDALDGTESPVKVSEDVERDSTNQFGPPLEAYEPEIRMLQKSKRAMAFGPQDRQGSSSTRSLNDDRTISAPAVERSLAGAIEEHAEVQRGAGRPRYLI